MIKITYDDATLGGTVLGNETDIAQDLKKRFGSSADPTLRQVLTQNLGTPGLNEYN